MKYSSGKQLVLIKWQLSEAAKRYRALQILKRYINKSTIGSISNYHWYIRTYVHPLNLHKITAIKKPNADQPMLQPPLPLFQVGFSLSLTH